MDEADSVRLNVNGELVELAAEKVKWLTDLPNHPGWEVLTDLLAQMEEGTRNALESVDQPLDTIRGLQGRLSVVRDVRRLVERDLPAYKAMSKETR